MPQIPPESFPAGKPQYWLHVMIPAFLSTFFRWLRYPGRERQVSTFVFADTHFNDKKILRYCRRPWVTVKEMNAALVAKWNAAVRPEDDVYFLGDFVYYGSVSEWAHRLNGSIHFIRGNHDHRIHLAPKRKVLQYRSHRFLLVHNPVPVPPGWDGWVIHGHTHNNRMDEYPFIDGMKRHINVSAELVGYTPVDLDTLIALDLGTLQRMDTIRSNPVRRQNE